VYLLYLLIGTSRWNWPFKPNVPRLRSGKAEWGQELDGRSEELPEEITQLEYELSFLQHALNNLAYSSVQKRIRRKGICQEKSYTTSRKEGKQRVPFLSTACRGPLLAGLTLHQQLTH
jgi:hypothetical protein